MRWFLMMLCGVRLTEVSAMVKEGVEQLALVESNYRRATNREYILHQPHVKTSVEGCHLPGELEGKAGSNRRALPRHAAG